MECGAVEPRYTIEQIDLLQRLRLSGMTKPQIIHALESLERLDPERRPPHCDPPPNGTPLTSITATATAAATPAPNPAPAPTTTSAPQAQAPSSSSSSSSSSLSLASATTQT